MTTFNAARLKGEARTYDFTNLYIKISKGIAFFSFLNHGWAANIEETLHQEESKKKILECERENFNDKQILM